MDYFKLEGRVNTEMGLGEVHTDETDRHRLQHNHDMLSGQGKTIEDMKKTGLATVALLKDANQVLSDDRERIVKVANTNDRVAFEVTVGDKITTSIQLKQYKQKLMMIGVIVLLFIALVLLFFIKILRR